MAPAISRALWRALLRSARRYDAEPALRSLLATPRTVEHDLTRGAWTSIERPGIESISSAAVLSQRVLERAVGLLCGGGRLHVPGREAETAAGMVGAMRLAAREAVCSAPPHLVVDAAFSLLRRLDVPIRVADRVLGPALRVRAASSSSSALSLRPAATAALARGTVLVSHPLMRRDVVLLLEADGADGYAFGLVTNQPTANAFGAGPGAAGHGAKATASWTTGRRLLRDELAPQRRTREDDLAVFGESAVFYGGPDGGWNVTMLHPHAEVRGCVQVRDGLYYGGDLADAAMRVRSGEAEAADFTFYRGRVDWQPGALGGECALGEWVVADWGGKAWPPPGLMPRLARYAASATDLQPSVTVLGAPASGGRLRMYKLGAWAHVVGAVADGAALSYGAPHPLRDWLRLYALEPDEVQALQGGGAEPAEGVAPPAWRTREDWGVAEKWPSE